MTSRLPRPRASALRGPAFAVLMLIVMLVVPHLVTSAGQVHEQNFADVATSFAVNGPIALAIGLSILIGEFDIAVVGYYGLGSMIAVSMPHAGLAAALIVATLAGGALAAAQALVVDRFSISSVPVSLGLYLVLWGVVELIAHEASTVGYNNLGVIETLTNPIAGIFSWYFFIIAAIFIAAGTVMRFTRFGPAVRALGGDRRAARISGVPVRAMLCGAFCASGLIAGFGGALQGVSSANANGSLSFAPLITGVTAAVIGGLSLTGGAGSVFGIAMGVIALGFLQETFGIIGSDPNLVIVVDGGFLLLVALVSAPGILRLRRAAVPEMRRSAAPGTGGSSP
jgi:ribose transport system permease protein